MTTPESLEVVAMTTLPRPTLFHGIAWIAERRPPGPMIALHHQQLLPLLMPRAGCSSGLGIVGVSSR